MTTDEQARSGAGEGGDDGGEDMRALTARLDRIERRQQETARRQEAIIRLVAHNTGHVSKELLALLS